MSDFVSQSISLAWKFLSVARPSHTVSRQSKQIDDKRELTMTVNNGRPRQAISNPRATSPTSDHVRHEYVSVIVISALQEEQSTPKVLHANRT